MAKKGRGTNTHGHGTHRRGKGRKGGVGYAGTYKQRWIKTIKGGKPNSPRGKVGHFGKYGFTRGGLSKDPVVVNLDWLNENVDKEIDLAKMGIDKLLGHGKITKPLKIVVPAWSATAEKKVKAAGGHISK